jgi:hypothetical protein
MRRAKKQVGKRKASITPQQTRLRPGELDGLVLSHLAKNKDKGLLTASSIGKSLERSSGAVANCLGRLVIARRIRLAQRKPRAFEIR